MSCVTIDSGEVVCGYRISCYITSMSCVSIDSGEVVCGYRISCYITSMSCVTIDSGEVVCVVTGYRAVQQVCLV